MTFTTHILLATLAAALFTSTVHAQTTDYNHEYDHENEIEHSHEHDQPKHNRHKTATEQQHTSNRKTITIHGARANITVPGMTVTSAYFDIHNAGNNDITLTGVKSSITDRAEIHEHRSVDGLMKMQETTQGIHIPAGKTVALKPGGFHIMLMNIEKTINKDDIIDIELHFSDGSHINVSAKASRPSNKHHSDKRHHHH